MTVIYVPSSLDSGRRAGLACWQTGRHRLCVARACCRITAVITIRNRPPVQAGLGEAACMHVGGACCQTARRHARLTSRTLASRTVPVLEVIQKSMSLDYEPASEPLHISVKHCSDIASRDGLSPPEGARRPAGGASRVVRPIARASRFRLSHICTGARRNPATRGTNQGN